MRQVVVTYRRTRFLFIICSTNKIKITIPGQRPSRVSECLLKFHECHLSKELSFLSLALPLIRFRAAIWRWRPNSVFVASRNRGCSFCASRPRPPARRSPINEYATNDDDDEIYKLFLLPSSLPVGRRDIRPPTQTHAAQD